MMPPTLHTQGVWRGSPPRCPFCKSSLSGYGCESTDVGAPRPGDLSVCMYCHGLSAFETVHGRLVMRPATEQDVRPMAGQPHFETAMRVLKQASAGGKVQ